MVTIGIVDDEYAIRNLIEKCIIKALGGGQKTVRIRQFEDSETFLEAVSQGDQFRYSAGGYSDERYGWNGAWQTSAKVQT